MHLECHDFAVRVFLEGINTDETKHQNIKQIIDRDQPATVSNITKLHKQKQIYHSFNTT